MFSNKQKINLKISSIFNYDIMLIPLDINARGEGSQFKALPKLETLKLFAFVQRDVFL